MSDLGLDEYVERAGPVLPSGLCIISPRTKDVPAKRQHAMAKGQHLCMLLDGKTRQRPEERSIFSYSLISQWKVSVSKMVKVKAVNLC